MSGGETSTSTVPPGIRAASEWAWRFLVISGAVGVAFYLLRYLSEIVVPVVVAILLTALLLPFKRQLARFFPKGLAAGLTVLLTLAVISGLLTLVGSQFSSGFSDLTNQVTEGITQVRDWIGSTFHITNDQFDAYFKTMRDSLKGGNLTDVAATAGLTATHFVAGMAIALFSLFFFLYEGEKIWRWVVRIFPRTARPWVASSGVIAWGQLSAFTRATVIVAAVDALGIGLGAWALDVPFAIAIGLLVFLGAFVPIIGAAISGSVAVLLALVAHGPVKALIMLGIVIAVQQLEAHILQPFLLGRAVSVHPLAVILAIAGGVVVGGIVGALVSVPLAAVVNAVSQHLLDEESGVASDAGPPAEFDDSTPDDETAEASGTESAPSEESV